MIVEGNIIKAENGATLRRKSDKILFGDEVQLGITWYIDGKKLAEPLLELPEHYEEVPLWLLDKEEEEKERIRLREFGEIVNNLIREKYTLSEELAIHRQRDAKKKEFEEYNRYCEECKSIARMTN